MQPSSSPSHILKAGLYDRYLDPIFTQIQKVTDAKQYLYELKQCPLKKN